ncbi:MAG: sugar ABC transporter substrate-binding protein [Chloroflexi bacterium]|nr:sugar ABC transporter substrate-binding protein [Chloroflexota bacterium]
MNVRKGVYLALGMGLVAGTTLFPAMASAQDPAPIHIEVVTHGQASDSFWSIFVNGVNQAAKDMAPHGVTVNYSAPQTFDMNAMAQLITAAVGKNPQGLVVSLPDATALGPAIKSAVDAGIPVISANSGSDVYKSLGILSHVGQDEFPAGKGAGERMAASGVKNAICINQEVGNAALDARCAGFAEGLGSANKSTVLQVDLNDQTGAASAIVAALQADPTIDAVMALGPTGAAPALKAVDQLGLTGKIRIGTFDLSPDMLAGIKAGTVDFAIDQQQFLQGYLPIQILTYYNLYGLLPGGGAPIYTGPGFVTADNVDLVMTNAGTTR